MKRLRVWLWAVCALVLSASSVEAQATVTSVGQFKQLVQRVSRELPAGDMQCQKRRQIVEHHLLGAKLQMDAASAERIDDWRTVLRAQLTHCRLEQWQAHFAGIDQALAQEVRKGVTETNTPLGDVPPLVITETRTEKSPPEIRYVDVPSDPVRIRSGTPGWVKGLLYTAGAVALYCGGAEVFDINDSYDCDPRRQRRKVTNETIVIIRADAVGVRLPFSFGW